MSVVHISFVIAFCFRNGCEWMRDSTFNRLVMWEVGWVSREFQQLIWEVWLSYIRACLVVQPQPMLAFLVKLHEAPSVPEYMPVSLALATMPRTLYAVCVCSVRLT